MLSVIETDIFRFDFHWQEIAEFYAKDHQFYDDLRTYSVFLNLLTLPFLDFSDWARLISFFVSSPNVFGVFEVFSACGVMRAKYLWIENVLFWR